MRLAFKSIFEDDDIFISYSRRDAFAYANRLATVLKSHGFSCFIDQWESPRGRHLPEPLLRALGRTKMLVLVGTTGAVASDFVQLELTEFLKRERPIIPVDVGRALETAPWASAPWVEIEGISRSPEPLENLISGEPSSSVIRRIEESYTFTRRNKRVRKGFWTAALLLPLLTLANIVGIAFLWVQGNRVATARTQISNLQQATSVAKTEAESARTEAETARANATAAENEAKIQRKAANEAEKSANSAIAEANKQRAAANLAIVESKKQKAFADQETRRAEKEAQTAEVQSIARQSLVESDSKRATLKALEAVDKSNKIDGTIIPAAEQALRQAIGNTGGVTLLEVRERLLPDTDWLDIQGIAFSLNRRWMIVGTNRTGGKRYLALWDLATSGPGYPMSSPKYFDTGLQDPPDVHSTTIDLTYIAISDDARWVVSTNSMSSMPYAWDLGKTETNRVLKPIPLKTQSNASRYGGVAFSPNNKWFVAASTLWRLTPDGPIDGKDLKTPGNEIHLDAPEAFSADGRWLVSTNWGSITLWDLHTANPTANPQKLVDAGESRDMHVTFSTDSEWLLAWGGKTGLRLWNLKTVQPTEVVLGKDHGEDTSKQTVITAATISPDNRWLIAGVSGRPMLWKLQRPAPILVDLPPDDHFVPKSETGEEPSITAVAFSNDSNVLAACTDDSAAVIWDLNQNGVRFNSRATFSSDDGPMTFCQFSPDQKWLLTYSSSLHLWDAKETGKSTSSIQLASEGGDLLLAQFDDNGRWLITRNHGNRGDTPLRLWLLQISDLIDLARQYVNK